MGPVWVSNTGEDMLVLKPFLATLFGIDFLTGNTLYFLTIKYNWKGNFEVRWVFGNGVFAAVLKFF